MIKLYWKINIRILVEMNYCQLWSSNEIERTNVYSIQILVDFFLITGQSLYITLCLGSIELDRVISEPCYKGIFYKETVGKLLFGSQDLAMLQPNPCYKE